MVNSEGISPTVWAQSYKDSGLDSYAYTPSSTPVAYSAWPTYQELIDAGTRVVSFLAQNADTSSVPYLLDEFTNVWETPYGVRLALTVLSATSTDLEPRRAANGQQLPLHGRPRDGLVGQQDGAFFFHCLPAQRLPC